MIASEGKITERNKKGEIVKIIHYDFYCRDIFKHMDGISVYARMFFFKIGRGKEKLIPVYQLEPTYISDEFYINFIKNRKVELINYKMKVEIEKNNTRIFIRDIPFLP